MEYALEEITRDVRIALDENEAVTGFIAADANTLSLEQMIGQKVPHAVRAISMSAPSGWLDDAPDIPDTTITWNTDNCGTIPLLDDLLRLVAFRMRGWQRPVTEPIDGDHPDYPRQRSRIPGVRGNPIKPVCAIVDNGKGRVLEFYSCDSTGDQVELAKYIPLPRIEEGRIRICRKVYEAVVYHAAGLCAATYRAENADMLFRLATEIIRQEKLKST